MIFIFIIVFSMLNTEHRTPNTSHTCSPQYNPRYTKQWKILHCCAQATAVVGTKRVSSPIRYISCCRFFKLSLVVSFAQPVSFVHYSLSLFPLFLALDSFEQSFGCSFVWSVDLCFVLVLLNVFVSNGGICVYISCIIAPYVSAYISITVCEQIYTKYYIGGAVSTYFSFSVCFCFSFWFCSFLMLLVGCYASVLVLFISSFPMSHTVIRTYKIWKQKRTLPTTNIILHTLYSIHCNVHNS